MKQHRGLRKTFFSPVIIVRKVKKTQILRPHDKPRRWRKRTNMCRQSLHPLVVVVILSPYIYTTAVVANLPLNVHAFIIGIYPRIDAALTIGMKTLKCFILADQGFVTAYHSYDIKTYSIHTGIPCCNKGG